MWINSVDALASSCARCAGGDSRTNLSTDSPLAHERQKPFCHATLAALVQTVCEVSVHPATCVRLFWPSARAPKGPLPDNHAHDAAFVCHRAKNALPGTNTDARIGVQPASGVSPAEPRDEAGSRRSDRSLPRSRGTNPLSFQH